MLRIEIFVPHEEDANISLRVVASGEENQDPRMGLQRALRALKAELEDYENCPYHKMRELKNIGGKV